MALACLTLLAFAVRLWFLLEESHPFGYDGYYYVTQLTRHVVSGHLHSPESSWVVWMMVPLRYLVGDSIATVKLASAALAAACVPAAYWTVAACGERREGFRLAPWLAAAWAAGSPVLSLLSAEFPKFLGMIVAGMGFWAVLWKRPCRKWQWPAMVALGLLTLTAHRLGILLVLAGAVGWLQPGAAWLSAKRTRLLLIVVGGVLVLFAGLSFFLPNLLHPSDLERLKGVFDGRPAWLPFVYFPLWSPSRALQIEFAAAWLLVPFLVWGLVSNRPLRVRLAAFLAAFVLCNFPFFQSQRLDLGFRLGLMGSLFTVLPALMLIKSGVDKPVAKGIVVAVSLAGLLVSPLGIQTNRMPPYDRYREMVARVPLPYPDKVIVHSGMNFYFGHLTRCPGVAWAPLPAEDRTRIYRIAWGIRDGEWQEFLERHPVTPGPLRIDPDYTYLREDTWEAFVSWSEELGDEDLLERVFSSKNPHREKPGYLLRNWE
jgi:hypothetical protein